mgnify:CR=1 FL=1
MELFVTLLLTIFPFYLQEFHIHHQLYFFSFAEQPTTQSHILLARQIEEKHSNGIALLYYMANQKASLKEYSVTYAHLISDIAHH